MKIFFVVGENSGDVLAAALIKRLKAKLGDDVECLGVGGPLMKGAGFKELLPMDQISIMGIWEVLPKIPRLLKINQAIIEEIEKQQPDIVVTVDFPDFNFRLGKNLKKRGIYQGKLIHYVAPSVWAWRPGRAKAISEFLDAIICLFPMEVEYFADQGLPTKCVGHPVTESKVLQGNGEMFKADNNMSQGDKTLGVFFGSREGEFKKIGPVLCQAARIIDDVEENLKIIIPTLPDLEYDVQMILEGFSLPVYISANPKVKWDAFKACDVAVAVSGTVALELAYADIPHIVVYKTGALNAILFKLMAKVKHVHLVNILLGEDVVPELLQAKCNPEQIAEAVLALSNDKDAQAKQREKFAEFRRLLGGLDGKSPSEKAADFVVEVAQGMHKKSAPIVKPKMPKQKPEPEPKVEVEKEENNQAANPEENISTVIPMNEKSEELKEKAEIAKKGALEAAQKAINTAESFLERFKK
ncbi:MAG: lipid-A-disaccharide synthase [Alphaproteobacteria bacterium]|nr:lipid-A-disaccharide synthase [Alphaproteobacteria bacterium]